nr:helix-hairpin-helix domain-containing protein [Streptomyces sp. SN-593]
MTSPTPPDDSTAPAAPPAPANPPASAALADGGSVPAARPRPAGKPDLAGLAAAMRSIERGENPAAPAPRGDAAEARRKRREAMAEETARLQALEAAEAPGAPGGADEAEPAEPGGEHPDAEGRTAPSASEEAPAGAEGTEPTPEDAEDAEDTEAVGRERDASGEDDAATAADAPGGGTPEGSAQPAGGTEADPDTEFDPDTAANPSGPDDEHGTAGAEAAPAAADGRRRDADSTTPGPDHPDDQDARLRGGGPGGGDRGRSAAATPSRGPQAAGAAPGAARPASGADARGAGGAAASGAPRAPLDAAAVAAAREVLAGGGAPGELAEPVVRALGEGAAELVRQDPWGVLGLPGVRVGVEQVDAFARAVLGGAVGPGDARRVCALVGHVLDRAAEQGHTALGGDALRAALARWSVPDPDAALAAAVEEGRVLVFRAEPEGADAAAEDAEDAEPAPVPLLFGLDRYALAEESLADGCVRLLRSFEGAGDGAEPDWEAAAAAAPSPSAAELIRAAAADGLVLHTGGEAARAEPAALVAAARAAGLRAYAAAYTDSGRRRLAAVPGIGEEGARTVAGLLAGARAADGSLPVDLLAVLDAPQLSVEEAATLVEAVPDGARLVLSGDPHTLWSAGPGRAFADLLASKTCPRVASRTPDPGPIGELTSCVAVGELAPVDAPGKEVVVVPVRAPGEAVHRAVQLVADSVPRAFGVPPEHTQVITLAHGGPVGTRALNAALKERLNPGPGRFGGFDEGDRVVHVPAPGRTHPAVVVGAEPDGLRLDGEGGPVLVPRAEVAATVRHGWAVTGHQAAGIRWPAAVVVVPGDAGALLTRGWVYTAFSRGERHLSVVQGAEQALAAAVAGPVASERTTRLAAVLRELAAE